MAEPDEFKYSYRAGPILMVIFVSYVQFSLTSEIQVSFRIDM